MPPASPASPRDGLTSNHRKNGRNLAAEASEDAYEEDEEVEGAAGASTATRSRPSLVVVSVDGVGTVEAPSTARASTDDDEYHDAFPAVRLPLTCLAGSSGRHDGVEVPKFAFHAVIGFMTGLCSLLTSTGGPLIALPLFFRYYPRLSPVRALVLAQSLTIPNGICAFLIAARRSEFDVGLSLAIGVAVSIGIPIGAAVAKRLRPTLLRLLVGLMLIAVGLAAAGKVVLHAIEAATAELGGQPTTSQAVHS